MRCTLQGICWNEYPVGTLTRPSLYLLDIHIGKQTRVYDAQNQEHAVTVSAHNHTNAGFIYRFKESGFLNTYLPGPLREHPLTKRWDPVGEGQNLTLH
jgi:hypothetical protein